MPGGIWAWGRWSWKPRGSGRSDATINFPLCCFCIGIEHFHERGAGSSVSCMRRLIHCLLLAV